MEINKAQWQTDGDGKIRVSMPFAKVDVEKRIVAGWATLDNVDTQKDRVLAEASTRAFERFRGNIREMHQPIAAGRLLDFREDEFYHAQSGKTYKGIFVRVYVSKGAESTWEKVVDGTLQGFSIGGEITDASSEFDKSAGGSVRIIKDYDLVELSLVDSPANPLANVFAIEKHATGSVLKGMIADTSIENVFWCEEDKLAKSASVETYDCPACSAIMKNIGWLESGDEIQTIVERFTKQAQSANEGGVTDMENENAPVEAEVVETPAVDETVVEEAPVEVVEGDDAEVTETEEVEVVEEPAVEEEVVAEDNGLEKAIEALSDTIKKSQESTSEKITELEARFAEAQQKFEKSLGDLVAEHGSLKERFDSVTTQLGEVEKGLKTLEGSTALKKSASVGGATETPKPQANGVWSGSIFGA